MARHHDPNSRGDRACAIVLVVALHLALAGLVIGGSRVGTAPVAQPLTVVITLAPPPPPPQPSPPPRPASARPRSQAGASLTMARPAPLPAAPAPDRLSAPALLPAPIITSPPIDGGASPSAGSTTAGSGVGTAGTGPGGDGDGSGGQSIIGAQARLLSGGLDRRDYRLLRRLDTPAGRAMIALLVGPQGRVERCDTRQSSGDRAVDQTLCAILAPRMRWAPARDRKGRPLTVEIDYTAVWRRD